MEIFYVKKEVDYNYVMKIYNLYIFLLLLCKKIVGYFVNGFFGFVRIRSSI